MKNGPVQIALSTIFGALLDLHASLSQSDAKTKSVHRATFIKVF